MLADVINSPFFDPENPDPKYLTYLSRWHWLLTCRCIKRHDRILDIERGMFVCDICYLPSGFQVENGDFVDQCISCGDEFVVWNANVEGNFHCTNCGGDNAARVGQHNVIEDSQADYVEVG